MSDTKGVILNRMLADVDSSYDKSEGSFFYDVLSAVATELETSYKNNENELRKKHIATAVGKEIDELVKEYANMERKHSTQATGTVVITGTNGALITAGEIIASDNLNFIFTESKTIVDGTATVSVKCETYGSVGNVPVDAIKYFPKTLAGLQTVTNTEAFTNGYDEETDDELKERYYEKIGEPQTSGNEAQYKAWSKSVTGVGDAKVIPNWDKSNGRDGAGTVKIVIINSNKLPADNELITAVYDYIISVRQVCSGELTVVSATAKSIDINVTLDIDTLNYTVDETHADVEKNETDYFKSIAFQQDYVSYAQINNKILNSDGVKDCSNLLINNGTSNITLTENEIPVLGGVTFG